jgi:hypothetical protein
MKETSQLNIKEDAGRKSISPMPSIDKELAIEKIVYRLLENVKNTVKLNKINELVYHGNWYEEKK